MHSVIQRYFIEYLASNKKQHLFWLERSVEVFCKAYGEADARIKENPRIGMPDDYKRFLLHGKRLLAHLKHYARRFPEELGPLKKRMEELLPVIEAEADRLHRDIQAKIVGQPGENYQQTSIFDRANSLSESDSGTTSSQSQSQEWTPLDDDFSGYFLSPTATASDQLYNAYGVPVLPYPVDDDGATFDDDFDNEATPTLQDTSKAEFPPLGPLFGEGGWQTIMDPQRPQLKKGSTLLNQGSNDHKSPAGVSINRHTAEAPRRGSHVSSRDSLAEIRKYSPTPPRGGGVIKGGRSLSQGTTTRPTGLLRIGANHYGMVAAGLTPTDELSHAELSMAFAGIPVPGSSTAAFTQRFKENVSPSRKSSKESSNGGNPVLVAPTSARTSPGMEQQIAATMPPFPALATRSARSSPGQSISPFYPPGLPVERHSNSSLRLVEHPPPSFHQWNTTSYYPGVGLPRVESSSLGEDGAMTMSYPPPIRTTMDRPLHRQAGGVFTSPTTLPWPEDQRVVTSSMPMSRNPSSSSPSYGSYRRSPDSMRGGVPPAISIAIPDRGRRHSSPLSSPVSPVVMPSARYPIAPSSRASNSRPASVVTEPSPRIVPRYEALEMPYQLPLSVPEVVVPPIQQARVGPQSALTPNSGGGQISQRPPLQVVPERRQSRYKRAWGKFRSGRGGANTGSGSVSRGRSQSSASNSPRVASVQSSPDPSLPSPLGSSGVVGGEPMGRSGSGGIVVGRGVGGGRRQIIAFGDAPVDVDVASHRLQQRRENRARRNHAGNVGQATPTTMAPPMSRSSSDGVGLGIMPEGQAR